MFIFFLKNATAIIIVQISKISELEYYLKGTAIYRSFITYPPYLKSSLMYFLYSKHTHTHTFSIFSISTTHACLSLLFYTSLFLTFKSIHFVFWYTQFNLWDHRSYKYSLEHCGLSRGLAIGDNDSPYSGSISSQRFSSKNHSHISPYPIHERLLSQTLIHNFSWIVRKLVFRVSP